MKTSPTFTRKEKEIKTFYIITPSLSPTNAIKYYIAFLIIKNVHTYLYPSLVLFLIHNRNYNSRKSKINFATERKARGEIFQEREKIMCINIHSLLVCRRDDVLVFWCDTFLVYILIVGSVVGIAVLLHFFRQVMWVCVYVCMPIILCYSDSYGWPLSLHFFTVQRSKKL